MKYKFVSFAFSLVTAVTPDPVNKVYFFQQISCGNNKSSKLYFRISVDVFISVFVRLNNTIGIIRVCV